MLLVIFLSLWAGGMVFKNPFLSISFILFIFLISYKKTKTKGIVAILISFLLGLLLSFFMTFHPFTGQGQIGFVSESKDNYIIFNSWGRSYYISIKNHNYDIGDLLKINGSLKDIESVTIESQFNFADYLADKGINKEIQINEIKTIITNPIRIKTYQNFVLSKFDEDSRVLANAILFNHREDASLINNLSSLHLARLISTSGIYIWLFINGLNKLLSKKIPSKYSILITLGFLSIYFVFTFPRFAIGKIIVITILKWVNRYKWKNRLNYLEIISLSGIIFLLVDISLARQDSFLLSYGFSLLFYVASPSLTNQNFLKKGLISLVFSSLFFVPFELSFYNSISPLSYLFVPILTPIFGLFACSSLLCFYGIPLQLYLPFIIKPILLIADLSVKCKVEIYAPQMPSWLIIILYCLLLYLAYLFVVRLRKAIRLAISLSYSIVVGHCLPLDNLVSEQISFINVGQGDATLIRKSGATFLIDTGGLKYIDVAKTSLIPYFKKQRIYKIDYVIVTHHDFDHTGAYESLKANFRVEHFIDSYQNFPLTYKGVTFTNYNTHINEYKEENDKSLVLGFTLMNFNYLIMGDAPSKVEENILKENENLNFDVVKVGHHGSDSSTSNSFIRAVKPKTAIISCGKNNRYGHPHQKVLNVLNKYGVDIYRTDEDGTIVFKKYYFLPWIIRY